MDMLLSVKDSRMPSLIQLLKGLRYVDMQPLSAQQSEIIQGVRRAVDEMKCIHQGTLSAIPAEELLDEL